MPWAGPSGGACRLSVPPQDLSAGVTFAVINDAPQVHQGRFAAAIQESCSGSAQVGADGFDDRGLGARAAHQPWNQ
jgi:hypothetical protein